MIFLLPLLLAHASASELSLQYGAAVTDVDKPQESQYFSAQWSEPIYGGVRWRVEAGGYTRLRAESEDRYPSAFGNVGVGLRPNTGRFLMESYWGVGGITRPDANLGGPFNFFHSFRIGAVDKQGVGVVLWMNHISSAGINNPNVGRDFAGFSWVVAF